MAAMMIRTSPMGTKFSWRRRINFVTAGGMGPVSLPIRGLDRANGDAGEAEHAELFCVGFEFTHPPEIQRALAEDHRGGARCLSREVTYGANWNDTPKVKFWDALDYIGVLPISR